MAAQRWWISPGNFEEVQALRWLAHLHGLPDHFEGAFVTAGTGARIVRNGTREGHEYRVLGSLRGEHKRLECLHVTLSAKSQTHAEISRLVDGGVRIFLRAYRAGKAAE